MDATTVLGSLTALDWVRLAGVIGVWLGPGAALTALWRGRAQQANLTVSIPIMFAFATAFYSVALAALIWLPLALTPGSVMVSGVAGWLIAGASALRSGGRDHPVSGSTGVRARLSAAWSQLDRFDLAALLTVGIVTVVSLWSIRGTYAGVGSDSYHHTLIAAQIAEHGRLPDDYGPVVPIATFSYHFGFHGVIGIWAMLSGEEPRVLMPIGAQILRAIGVWAVGSLTWLLYGRKPMVIVAIGIAGLVSIFPALAFNWGRFPQMWALGMCAVWIGLWASQLGSKRAPTDALLLGVLAAGIVLTHYRVTLFTLTAVAGFVIAHLGLGPGSIRTVLAVEGRAAGWTGVAAVLGIASWVAHVWLGRAEGFSLVVGTATAGAFDLARLGPVGLSYPTNPLLLGLLALVLVWAIRRRDLPGVALQLWIVTALTLSQPWALGDYMDTISVVISLFVPGSTAVAALVTAAWRDPDRLWRRLAMGAGVLLGLGAAWGVWTFGNLIKPDESYLRADDLVAAAWIREHTPPDSLWMVNTFSFPFFPELVFGSDGGYWLPLTADRATVTLPMTFSIERGQDAALTQRLVGLHQLGADLTTPEAITQLQAYGVTHVYLGQRGGPINAQLLDQSPHFERQYSHNAVRVYRLTPAP